MALSMVINDLIGDLEAERKKSASLQSQADNFRTRLGRLTDENINLRAKLRVALVSDRVPLSPNAHGALILQKEALRKWQTWWSGTMRPAVVRLVEAVGPVTDYLQELHQASLNFPTMEEYPVGGAPKGSNK